MCNVMVIYPRPNEYKKPRFGFSYNWALLCTILHNSGHKVIPHDYSCEDFNEDVFFNQLAQEKIQVVIIEFDSFSLKRSENDVHGTYLVKYIKKNYPKIMTAVFGYYCCITGNDIPYSDITIKQNNISHLLTALHQLNNDIGAMDYSNFDSLPFIDRLLIQKIPYFNKNKISTLIETARGCENSCIFCQRKGWQSRYISHGYDYIFSEFESLSYKGFKNIWIIDENFTFKLSRAKNILKGLIERESTKNMNIAISSWANIDTEFLDIASQANIKTISFGIESGNKDILKFYRKNINLEKATHLIQYANSIGIFTVGNFIIGAPAETIDTINETFSFIRECSFDQVNIKTLDYMIGSDLYSSIDNNCLKGKTHIFACKENGLNNFHLQNIKNIKDTFRRQYYKDRQQQLKKKIILYGFPFPHTPTK